MKSGTEFKVGVFTLATLAVIGYMIFILNPGSFSSSDIKTYYSIVKDAAGVVTKTQVKTNGVVIGTVSNIELQTNTTRITMTIRDDVKIPIGSTLDLKEKGLLGDVFVEIIRPQDSGKYIKSGGFIPPNKDHTSLSGLINMAGTIGKDVKKITGSLAKVLGGDKGAQSLTNIVDSIEDIAGDLKSMIKNNHTKVDSIVDNINVATASLRQLVSGDNNKINKIVDGIEVAVQDFKEAAKAIKTVLRPENRERIDSIVATLDTTMQDLQVTAKNARLVSDRVENGEGTLGKLISSEETLNEFQGVVRDVRTLLAPATRLKIAVDYHGELRQDSETQHYFNLWFRTRPDRGYLFGLTDTYQATKEVTIEDLPVQPIDREAINTIHTKEYIQERDAIRFNIQFFKRWYGLQLRFGLFETTGGIGSDFYFLHDRLKLSLEAFDWNNNSQIRKTAHLKTYLSMLFFQHTYAVIGIDDPTRIDQTTGAVNKQLNYFLGAGLKFNDNDIKSLFGVAAIAGSGL